MPIISPTAISPHNNRGGIKWSTYWATRAAFYQGEWDFVNNKLLDRTNNGNDFAIGNSYCINPNDAAVDAVLKSAITIDITAPFSVTFEVFKEAAVNSGIIAGGGNTLQDYIYLLNDKIWLGSAASGNVEFAVNATVGQWDRISITGDGSNVTVTNVTTAQTQTKARGTLAAIVCPRILGRGGSGALIHPIRYLNINDQYEWHFSEYPTTGTRTPKIYDVIGGNHATTQTTAHLQVRLDTGRHWNLRYGYSIWENGAGGVVWVPYGKDGNPLTLIVGTDIAAGYAKTFDCPAHISRHNGCETTIKAPAELLTYDVDNFMFDESDVAKEIAFENVAENRGNQIFANKTVENYYYELVVLKQPEV